MRKRAGSPASCAPRARKLCYEAARCLPVDTLFCDEEKWDDYAELICLCTDKGAKVYPTTDASSNTSPKPHAAGRRALCCHSQPAAGRRPHRRARRRAGSRQLRHHHPHLRCGRLCRRRARPPAAQIPSRPRASAPPWAAFSAFRCCACPIYRLFDRAARNGLADSRLCVGWEDFYARPRLPERLVLVIGSEGRGVSAEVSACATRRFKLPMVGGASRSMLRSQRVC